jgi:hypothetical protein
MQVFVMNTRSIVLTACCPLFICFLSTTSAGAAEFEQRPPHEHGKVTINAALDGSQLVIELDSPAINVVGFEHEPRTDSERAAVRNAADLLKSGRGLFSMPKQALCVFKAADIKAPQWEAQESSGEHAEHEHHADYEARFTYRCEAPNRLTWIEPTLLGSLRNVIEARVNIATATGQHSEVVTTGHARVPLK